MLSVPSAYVGGRSCFRRAQSSRGHRELSLEQGDVVTWMMWMAFHQAKWWIQWWLNGDLWSFTQPKWGKHVETMDYEYDRYLELMFPVDFPVKDHRFERRLSPFFLFTVFSLMKSTFAALEQIEGPAEWWDISWVCPKSGYSYPKVGGLSLFFAVKLPVLGAYSMDPKMNAPSWVWKCQL